MITVLFLHTSTFTGVMSTTSSKMNRNTRAQNQLHLSTQQNDTRTYKHAWLFDYYFLPYLGLLLNLLAPASFLLPAWNGLPL